MVISSEGQGIRDKGRGLAWDGVMEDQRKYVEERYLAAIRYYWFVAVRNKRAYKSARYLTVVLGSLLTLVASLSSAEFFQGHKVAFAIITPVLAALLTMIGSFAQSFQWGATWREMVLIAERLQKELDRVRLSKGDGATYLKDVTLLNDLIIQESSGFFDRVMGSSSTGREQRPVEPADDA